MAAKLLKASTPGIYRPHAKDCDREGRCDCVASFFADIASSTEVQDFAVEGT